MAASNEKQTGANKVMSNRVTKFRLPERTSRPPDDAYFDRVLSAVERKDTPAVKAKPAVNDSEELTSAPSEDLSIVASSTASYTVPLRPAEASNSPIKSVNDPQSNVAVPPAVIEHSSSQRVPLSPKAPAQPTPSRSTTPATSLPHVGSSSFTEFRKRWSLFLTDTHMNLCEEIFRNTVAVGRDNYDTTASTLCQAVNKSRRHTFLLLQQLEKMGFVTRKEIKDKNRLLGIRIWFHLMPLQQ